MQIEFDEHGCKPFFKKHRQQKELIKESINTAVEREIATGMTKVKVATKKKIAKQTIYEFPLNLGKLGSARLAFSATQNRVIIYFISSHLQKSTFNHEFEQVIDKIG
ncbi:hypothetical protein [Limosilactobacillus agrestimuris]|uniref:hypothetical protein n=1 Tax=Limosilactobacillus agrestimuris TaxID=2941331 RepID=UPI002042452B|nr:hypothetical protein [Limosilactobacillus agrestimuris]